MKLTHKERAARRELMAAQVKSGQSIAEVARRHGVTTMTVRGACEAHAVEPLGDRRIPSHPQPSLLRTYAAILRAEPGDSLATVGERLGMTKQAVYRAAQAAWRLGLPTGRWQAPGTRSPADAP